MYEVPDLDPLRRLRGHDLRSCFLWSRSMHAAGRNILLSVGTPKSKLAGQIGSTFEITPLEKSFNRSPRLAQSFCVEDGEKNKQACKDDKPIFQICQRNWAHEYSSSNYVFLSLAMRWAFRSIQISLRMICPDSNVSSGPLTSAEKISWKWEYEIERVDSCAGNAKESYQFTRLQKHYS